MSHLFSPRSVITLPLVPTTQRRGKLLEECAVTSPVTSDASRAPHELFCLTSTPLEFVLSPFECFGRESRYRSCHATTPNALVRSASVNRLTGQKNLERLEPASLFCRFLMRFGFQVVLVREGDPGPGRVKPLGRRNRAMKSLALC